MITNLTFKLPDLPTNAYTNAVIGRGNANVRGLTEEEMRRLLSGIDQKNFQLPPPVRPTPPSPDELASRGFYELILRYGQS